MPEFSREELKAVIKESMKEWLDSKYAEFGKFTLHGVLAWILVGLAGVAWLFHSNGWMPK